MRLNATCEFSVTAQYKPKMCINYVMSFLPAFYGGRTPLSSRQNTTESEFWPTLEDIVNTYRQTIVIDKPPPLCVEKNTRVAVCFKLDGPSDLCWFVGTVKSRTKEGNYMILFDAEKKVSETPLTTARYVQNYSKAFNFATRSSRLNFSNRYKWFIVERPNEREAAEALLSLSKHIENDAVAYQSRRASFGPMSL